MPRLKLYSHNKCLNDTDENLCAQFLMESWTYEPAVDFILCDHWINSGKEDACTKNYGLLNVNYIDNFFCKKCIDKLIDYYVAVFNYTKIDRMITFVNSFNLKDAHVTNR